MDDIKEEQAELSTAQKARIERNRLKALMLKEAKLIAHPLAKMYVILTCLNLHKKSLNLW